MLTYILIPAYFLTNIPTVRLTGRQTNPNYLYLNVLYLPTYLLTNPTPPPPNIPTYLPSYLLTDWVTDLPI